MIVVICKMHINIKNLICNYSNNLIESEKLETENILIFEEKYKDLVICFISYVNSKLIKMLSLHYDKLMGKIEEHEGKKYLIVDNYMLDKALDKIKEIKGNEKFDNI